VVNRFRILGQLRTCDAGFTDVLAAPIKSGRLVFFFGDTGDVPATGPEARRSHRLRREGVHRDA